MGKKHRETRDEEIPAPLTLTHDEPPPPEVVQHAAWGYGFEKTGAKYRGYRVQGNAKEYITEPRELHAVIAAIQVQLGREVSRAIHAKPPKEETKGAA